MAHDHLSNAVIDELLAERRRDRFWRNVRFALFIALALTGLGLQIYWSTMYNQDDDFSDEPYVSMVSIEGLIAPGQTMASDDGLRKALYDAFSDESAEAVVIRINSPGGTPVQSNLIRKRIEAMKEKFGKRVIVVGEEMLTSGAYLIAMAGDVIYTMPSTIVGSIGVRMSSFGAVDLIEKLGVERRIYTAGENKVLLDPFKTEDPRALAHNQTLLDSIHTDFINTVKAARGDRLAMSEADLFSGLYWTGLQSKSLGLIDEIGNVRDAIVAEAGTVRIRSYGPHESVLTRLGFVTQALASLLTGRSVNGHIEALPHF